VKPGTRNRREDIAFSEVVSHSAFGPRFSGDAYANDGNVAILRTTDLDDDGRISYETMPLAQLNEDQFAGHLLKPGDLVITRSGTCGIAAVFEAFTRPVLPGAFTIRFRLNSLAEPQFFRYYFNSPAGRMNILSVARGAVQENLNITSVETLRVPLPPLAEQQIVVGVLRAHDDLIENNRRRMALLEMAARLLYEGWFVRLRFPGHERARMVGGVPEGWERKPLSELCERIDYGYTASAEQEEIGPKFLRITDIVPEVIDWSAVPYCPIEDEKLERFRLLEGDIVVARTGATVGYAKRLHKRHPDTVFASYLVRLRLKPEVDNIMVGVFVESDSYKDYVQSRVGGAAQPNANARVLAGAEMLVPPRRLQHDFHEFVEPLVDEREVLQQQNQKLKAARDLLLPRLMSGEIAV
jgi:type I restriction enzyme S subunit